QAVAVEVGRRVELAVVAVQDLPEQVHVGRVDVAVEVEVAQAGPKDGRGEQAGEALDVGVAVDLEGNDGGHVVAVGQAGDVLGPQVAVDLAGLAAAADHAHHLGVR